MRGIKKESGGKNSAAAVYAKWITRLNLLSKAKDSADAEIAINKTPIKETEISFCAKRTAHKKSKISLSKRNCIVLFHPFLFSHCSIGVYRGYFFMTNVTINHADFHLRKKEFFLILKSLKRGDMCEKAFLKAACP